MEVYVELVIVDNFVITYAIAALSYRVCSIKRSVPRYLIASAGGTLVALFYPFIHSTALSLVVRAASYVAICAVLFAGKRRVILPSIAFALVTFCFGGATLAAGLIIFGDVGAALNARLSDVPLSAIVASCFVAYRGVARAAAYVKRRRETTASIYRFSFKLCGKRLTFNGLLDTGNALRRNGLPVVVIGLDAALRRIESVELLSAIKAAPKGVIRTASGEGGISYLNIEDFRLYSNGDEHILYDVEVGICSQKIGERGEYEALLPLGAVNGEINFKDYGYENGKTA